MQRLRCAPRPVSYSLSSAGSESACQGRYARAAEKKGPAGRTEGGPCTERPNADERESSRRCVGKAL